MLCIMYLFIYFFVVIRIVRPPLVSGRDTHARAWKRTKVIHYSAVCLPILETSVRSRPCARKCNLFYEYASTANFSFRRYFSLCPPTVVANPFSRAKKKLNHEKIKKESHARVRILRKETVGNSRQIPKRANDHRSAIPVAAVIILYIRRILPSTRHLLIYN